MNFALLNKAKVKPAAAPQKQEFDVKKYLDQRSNMTYQVDLFFGKEPIPLLDSAEMFDFSNDFKIVELEDSLVNIIEQV